MPSEVLTSDAARQLVGYGRGITARHFAWKVGKSLSNTSAIGMAFTTGTDDMISLQHIEVGGERFVLLPEREYERLCSKAGETVPLTDDDLPPLPKPDKNGNFPAGEYAPISLARDIIRDRKAAGLTQADLARLAGTRQHTISRIEGGKYTASAKVVDKIDRVLRKAITKRKR